MDAVSNAKEGLHASSYKGDTDCKCWSPKRSEEVCMCHYAEGHTIHDINTGDMKEKSWSSGLRHQNTLSRRVVIQQLKELINRSDMILQNGIRLQMMSHNLLRKSIRLQDLCVMNQDSDSMIEEIESMSEGQLREPQQHDSMTQHYVAIVQDNGSMTETSLGSHSG